MNDNIIDVSKINVLLVDDTPANLDVLRKTLEPEGYNISFAPSGKVALNIIPESLPDLILLDVMMPDMDGFETCRRLKGNETTRDIPIIFVTAKSETKDIVDGFHVGGVDYITKPFRQEEVCARVKTHVQLEVSKKRLQALTKQKNKFLGMAAHDLRSPLNSIRGFSKILLEQKKSLPEETSDELLRFINSLSDQMLDLVNTLLDISVIESGNIKLQLKNGSISKLIEERIRIAKILATKKNITIHVSESASNTRNALFDSNRIAQVIDNLLSNAIKFSPLSSNIYVNLENEENTTKISVRDEGPGISPKDQVKLFGEFQKLSTKPTGGESSTGLGLAIVKKIVKAHKGTLEVDSHIGKGSKFCFTLSLT